MSSSETLCPPQFKSVAESSSFLDLFPHRFDFIQSPHGGMKPSWKSISDYPLSDRLIYQGAYLYGVRFGAQTSYAMIDIDRGSQFHPNQDPLAIDRLKAALEVQLG
jgi:hypothetical protein